MSKEYPKFSVRKAAEAVSLLLKMHGGKMSRFKLIKLLYLADRKAIENYARPITYDEYFSTRGGQVLGGVLDLIDNLIVDPEWHGHIGRVNSISITLTGKPIKLNKLSPAEVEILEDIYGEFGDWNRFDLGNYTKTLPEYKSTTKRVRTTIEELLGHIFDKEEAEQIEQRLEEVAYLECALGG